MDFCYAFSVLLSAFLVFQVEPMMGKALLPWFGGTPAVWSAVLLFFQAALAAGYAYAYALLGRLRGRAQAAVHVALLGGSLALLGVAALVWPSPLTPGAAWRPEGSGLPVWGIFRILAAAVGVPYSLLASNSTLMQAWLARTRPGRTPYRLYALSNAGSLLALVSYPVLFEPLLSLRAQAYVWAAGYALFAGLAAYLALRAAGQAPAAELAVSAGEPSGEKRPGVGAHLLWIALAACASALLVAVSSQITQEVAPVPFLWVLPLVVYLVTFILAFSAERWYRRGAYLAAYLATAAAGAWALVKYPPFGIGAQLAIYTLLLFVCCMICHNELFRLRPHPRHLPSFYLMVAVGGAVGGTFVTLVAPYLFRSGFWELQWAVVACGLLLAIATQRERPAIPRRGQRRARRQGQAGRPWLRPAALAAAGGAVLLGGLTLLYTGTVSAEALVARRNFYGVLRVWENEAGDSGLRTYQLTHGKTAHGFQFADPRFRALPTTYYAESSGVGLAILNHPARPAGLRVGALGLGVGVIATYGQPGDVYRFYEINPGVTRIARGEGGYFSYLADSQATVQVVEGDARISLERELASEGPQGFDLLVLDTFNGDAMPLHLLSKEAFALYLQHLKPGGIIAVNASNRYFNLHHQVFRLADALGLAAALIEDRGDGIQSYDSVWVLLARDAAVLQQPAIAARTAPRPAIPAGLKAWSDDFSNLLQVLK